MGRTFIIFAFLLSFGLALWLFLSRDTKPLRENIEAVNSDLQPRVILKHFTARRYVHSVLKSQMSAQSGFFLAPNLLEAEGDVKGWQLRDDKEQTLSAQTALVYFDSKSLVELLNQSQIDAVHLKGFVELAFAEHLLTTDFAKYLAKADLIVGDRPVRVDGPGRWFEGYEGFKLQVKQEALDIYGPVRGMVKPNGSEKNRRPH